jgi:hypothetical protein
MGLGRLRFLPATAVGEAESRKAAPSCGRSAVFVPRRACVGEGD